MQRKIVQQGEKITMGFQIVSDDASQCRRMMELHHIRRSPAKIQSYPRQIPETTGNKGSQVGRLNNSGLFLVLWVTVWPAPMVVDHRIVSRTKYESMGSNQCILLPQASQVLGLRLKIKLQSSKFLQRQPPKKIYFSQGCCRKKGHINAVN